MAWPDDLPAALMAHRGLDRRTALNALNELAALGWLVAERRGRRKHFAPGTLREVVRRYALDGLSDDSPWTRDFAPCLDLPAPVLALTQHVFTELLNNAIDHSGGTQVVVSLRQTATQAQLLVSDNGCGIFDRIGRCFAIDDPALVLLELTKGRLTTDPQRHTGRGLFYTLRAADVLDLRANVSAWQHRHWEGSRWRAGRALGRQGTSVYVAIALDTARRLDEVLRSASVDGPGYGLERTVVPLRLLAESSGLVSRSQARRVAARLADFRAVTLDFEGVTDVGHSFADELLRVFPAGQPDVEITAVHMTSGVAAMLECVRPGANHGGPGLTAP
jgi:anti-sigma regulatory factor (Ser/Thr protein kinase)